MFQYPVLTEVSWCGRDNFCPISRPQTSDFFRMFSFASVEFNSLLWYLIFQSYSFFFISQIRSEENNKHTQNKESATSLFEPWNKTNFSMETSLPLTRLPRMPSKTLLTASAWAWLRKADPGTAQVFQNLVCL